MSKFWNDRVSGLTPYVPGEQTQDTSLLKLNTNESPYGPSPKVLKAIEVAADDALSRYPDPEATQLREAISQNYSLDTGQVFVGNGSDEVLAHIFGGLFKNTGPILSPEITYGFYPIYCRYYGLEYRSIPVTEDLSVDVDLFGAVPDEPGGIILANPNAATGVFLGIDKIRQLLQTNTDITVVVDEAYVDFGGESAIPLLAEYENLVVVQTCSKSRGLAGLRVGLALGSLEMVEGLTRMKDSFNSYPLDRLAQVGAAAAFSDTTYFEETRKKVIATREKFAKQIRIAGYELIESSANFMLVRHPSMDGEEFHRQLRARSVLVRHLSGKKLASYIRISIGTDEQMDIVANIFRELISHSNDR